MLSFTITTLLDYRKSDGREGCFRIVFSNEIPRFTADSQPVPGLKANHQLLFQRPNTAQNLTALDAVQWETSSVSVAASPYVGWAFKVFNTELHLQHSLYNIQFQFSPSQGGVGFLLLKSHAEGSVGFTAHAEQNTLMTSL